MQRQRYQNKLPKRVRVLILGGGIHGVGLLHDLASRGFHDAFLVEKNFLASGTSSRSTKLIHGGLRYLRRLSEFSLVAEALAERQLLLSLAPDLVKPLEFYFPILHSGGERSWLVKAGLSLYDALAGKNGIHKHTRVAFSDVGKKAPGLDLERFQSIYSFWDGQTDDLALVGRVAASAIAQGGRIAEACKAQSIRATSDGWDVEVVGEDGNKAVISALYVVNCLGPWAHEILERSHLQPLYQGVKNKGVHLLFPDIGLQVGVFLQSPADQRILFLLPWQGYTLLGTTETLYTGESDRVEVEDAEVEYLLGRCRPYLKQPLEKKDILMSFAGLRWLALEDRKNISTMTRESLVSEHSSGRGLLLTLYGGKLTSYRSLAEKLGDRIATHFGEFRPSQTRHAQVWLSHSEVGQGLRPDLYELQHRFGAKLSW